MNNYSITFKSLRAGTVYTLNIGGGTGNAIPLKGGAQPFTTQEDDSDDMFTPIRTQTGYIRIVDDGKDANGNVWNWKDLIPANDTSRPVTLTAGGSVVWQGFMQPQSFSGTLYGNPQEREFPVMCVLGMLNSVQVKTTETSYRNFAYLFDYIIDSIPTHTISQIIIQGGSDARSWLRMKFDWRNFLSISDGDVSPSYSLLQILEDVCRFWGWTARTYGQQIILTAVDDRSTEPNALTLTTTELHNIGLGTSGDIGSVAAMYSSATVGNSFASTDNEEVIVRGYSKAVVKADCNASTSELAFAPQSIRNLMESQSPGYQYYSKPGSPKVGYFTTPEISGFNNNDCRIMSGDSTTYGGFSRRQIYTEEASDSPDIVDCIDIRGWYSGTAKAWLESTYEMSFPGGSLELKGSIYSGYDKPNYVESTRRNIKMAIGIGPSRVSNQTRWLNISYGSNGFSVSWTTTKQIFPVLLNSIPTLCPAAIYNVTAGYMYMSISKVPVDSDLSGRVFVEFYGSPDVEYERVGTNGDFQIADFSVAFSRDAVTLTSSRGRTAIKSRYSSQEYKSVINNDSGDTQNVDCIFATDNNMEYGYGLLMNANGSFMGNAPYNGSYEIPEQHLADRIGNYYSQSRRMLVLDLNNENITPLNTATVNDTLCYPIAISKNWRDDRLNVTMIQI